MSRATQLAGRNLKEIIRDPVSLAISVALPLALLLALQALGTDESSFLAPTRLTPGIVMFGFVMVMFSSAMILARDRETALLSRLLTTPLRSSEFVAGYSMPYLAVAALQSALLMLVGVMLGLEVAGSAIVVLLVLSLMAMFYVALGMIAGATLTVAQTSGAYALVLMLTIFGGAWFDLEAIGGAFVAIGDVLPFKHALDAMRSVMADDAGFADVTTDIVWVTGYTCAAVVGAIGIFRRRMLE